MPPRAFIEPASSISAPGGSYSRKINDLEPARGRTVRGAECYGLELVSSFRGGRIHRTEHLGTGNDVVACGERDFHVVKINTKHACIIRRPGAPNGVPADLLTVKTRGIAWQKPERHPYDGFGTGGERYRAS